MILAADIEPLDWHRMLWSEDAPPAFLLEIVVRCVIAYLLMLGALRVTGRRGVRQLSIFELTIILGLGSAAGDVMFYDDVALSHVLVVFVMVTALYWFFNRLTEWFPRFGDFLEGKPILLIEEGKIKRQNLDNQNLTPKELFGELRQHQVEHLGQVRRAYLEATGNLSVYFYPEDEPVRPGLPIWPERIEQGQRRAEGAGPHACCHCGHVRELARGEAAKCAVCENEEWLPASEEQRVG